MSITLNMKARYGVGEEGYYASGPPPRPADWNKSANRITSFFNSSPYYIGFTTYSDTTPLLPDQYQRTIETFAPALTVTPLPPDLSVIYGFGVHTPRDVVFSFPGGEDYAGAQIGAHTSFYEGISRTDFGNNFYYRHSFGSLSLYPPYAWVSAVERTGDSLLFTISASVRNQGDFLEVPDSATLIEVNLNGIINEVVPTFHSTDGTHIYYKNTVVRAYSPGINGPIRCRVHTAIGLISAWCDFRIAPCGVVAINSEDAPEALELDGSGSFDADGTITRYYWFIGTPETSLHAIGEPAGYEAPTLTTDLEEVLGTLGYSSGESVPITLLVEDDTPLSHANDYETAYFDYEELVPAGAQLGSLVTPAGDLLTAHNSGNDVQLQRFPGADSNANREALATLPGHKNPSIIRTRSGVLRLLAQSRSDGAWRLFNSNDEGRTLD